MPLGRGELGVDIDQGGLIIAVVHLSNSQVTNGCSFRPSAPRSSSEGVALAGPCERSQARASLSEKMRSAWTLLAIRLQPLLCLRGDLISSAPPSILA